MIKYEIESIFNFGKFKGKTLLDVLSTNPNYVKWCFVNVATFYINNLTINEIRVIIPNFLKKKNEIKLLKTKTLQWDQECFLEHPFYEEHDSNVYSDSELYTQDWDYILMNPAHNPSENPWIAVFGAGDEAESAYWNTH